MSFPRVIESSILREVVTAAWAVVGYGLASGGNGPFVGDLREARQRLQCAEGRLRPDHPAADLHRLPADVGYQYVCVDTRVLEERIKFSGIFSASNRSEGPDVALDGEEGYIFESPTSGRVSLRLG